MNKSKINYVVDFFLCLSFFVTAITGLIIFFFLPSGVRQGSSQQFMGFFKGTWSSIHDWAGISMIFVSTLHLILHRKWVVCMTKSFFNKKVECDK